MKIEWRRVGDYEICWKENRIRRVVPDIQNRYAGRELKLTPDRGYLILGVTLDGKHYSCFHQVVALAYHGLCPRGKEVNHKDGNKLNNDPKNLEYVTHKQNFEHAVKNGLRLRAYPNYGIRNGNAKLTVKKVRKIKRLARLGWPQARIAKTFRVSAEAIWHIVHGRNWRYVN